MAFYRKLDQITPDLPLHINRKGEVGLCFSQDADCLNFWLYQLNPYQEDGTGRVVSHCGTHLQYDADANVVMKVRDFTLAIDRKNLDQCGLRGRSKSIDIDAWLKSIKETSSDRSAEA